MTTSAVLSTPHLSHEMLAQFVAPRGVHDEVRGTFADIKPTWQKLLASLDTSEAGELARRWERSQQLIRENGIVFGSYFDDREPTRPWQLDPMPLLIGEREWAGVEDALEQRAQLLELVLQDLYGPQRLIKDGHLPAEVLFLHPGPWRDVHGHPPVGGRYLNFYAADMARSPRGDWWILADRSESPSGVGFALENRVILSRMFPREFRDCHVKRLRPFFNTLQETLHHLAPRRQENPRIAILSEGPASENYFEDAYLARYLGYTLVESEDLTVRNQQLLLKTLGGLLPIDVVMRRSESAACDPLELHGSSRAGVVGLTQAARAGNVAICNALGSGLVESPIMLAFMPRLCQLLLAEPLKLPSVATWWCGQRDELTYVLENLDRLSVSYAFRNRRRERQITRQLQSLSADALAHLIRANPAQFVAQERVERSSLPKWQRGQFEAVYLALRSFVVASQTGFEVMTGGLARTSTTLASLQTSVFSGEGSKDTWVLTEEERPQPKTLPVAHAPIELRRSGCDLPSRVADNVFWLGRYIERAEFSVRLLRAVTVRLTSETDYRNLPDLPMLLRSMACLGQIDAGYVVDGIQQQLPSIDIMLPAFVANRKEDCSVRSVLESTLFIASKVRDRLSVDSWRILLNLDARFQEVGDLQDLTALLNLSNRLILDLSAFGGTVNESMTRTQAYRFLMIGRRLERALQIISLMDNCFLQHRKIPSELLEAALEVADSLMTYRSRYMANLQLSAVLDLILTDETNPRSLAFQLLELDQLVADLPRPQATANREKETRLAMSMLHEIRMVDIEAISRLRSKGDDRPLQALLAEVSRKLPLLSTAITHRYLVHAAPSQRLTEVTSLETDE